METTNSIKGALELAEFGDFRRSFLIALHKHLKTKMPGNKVDECPHECRCGRPSGLDPYRHFSGFCRLQGLDPYVAHSIFRIIYAEMRCDCQYLHYLKVTEGDPEPARTKYVERDWRLLP